MSVTINIRGIEATIDGGEWQCDSAGIAAVLNAMLPEAGPTGSDPDPDYTAAAEAARRLGGRIVREESVVDDTPEDAADG